jgi:ribosomal protein L37AE/L43A
MSDGFYRFAVENARMVWPEQIVNEVLTKHGIGRRTEPLCKTCQVPMRRVKEDLWQCPKCKVLEAL